METRLSPVFETKFAGFGEAAGIFQGYASTFGGEPDSLGDVIQAGAFAESLAEHRANGTSPAMFWAHQSAEPIGKWLSLAEDRRGLAVEGKLSPTRRGNEAHALMKDDALGLSIGYRVRTGGESFARSNRILKAVDLVEISVVALPANLAARITSVKSAAFLRPESIREFEFRLREACGFSVREAKRIASAGWP